MNAPVRSYVAAVRAIARCPSGLPECTALAFVLLVSLYLLRVQATFPSGSTIPIIAIGLLLLLLTSSAVIRRRPSFERTLIVGMTPLARKLLEEIAGRADSPYVVVGVADDTPGDAEHPFRELLVGPLERLGTIINEGHPDRIVVALTDRRGRLPVGALLQARVRGVAVEDAVDLYERLTGKLAIESLTPSNLISSRDFRKSHLDLAFGHALSLVASALGLVTFGPLFGLIALAIKLDSPGPVFFVQERGGAGGRRFRLLKFRTMRPAERPTSEWVRDNGDRITRVGKWLRKYRLDELPQLINVLRGEMNLVGPRPHPVCNLELFVDKIPYYSLRCLVRPGLTGWAQVRQGYANSLEEETEKMRYDLYYIKHMSAWLDLRILFRTVQTVLWGSESLDADVAPSGGQAPRARRLEFVRETTEAQAPSATQLEPNPAAGLEVASRFG